MNETDETYANAAHGMLKTGRQGKPLGQLDRIMAAGPAQQESFSKSPGTRGAPDRKGYPGGKARLGQRRIPCIFPQVLDPTARQLRASRRHLDFLRKPCTRAGQRWAARVQQQDRARRGRCPSRWT